MASDIAKQAAGNAAADLIQDDMLVGLGTGSTAFFFIEKLIERCRQGLKISAVASSERSKQQALIGGIPIRDINEVTSLDITADGADEIDQKKRMIKGGGGALLREKILASMSREMIVIVDESKLVKQLGKFPLPVEIVPFAYPATIKKIEDLGFRGEIRQKDKKIYITDNGNFIFDVHFQELCSMPEKINDALKTIPGVIETGFFFNLATRVLIGQPDGSVVQKN